MPDTQQTASAERKPCNDLQVSFCSFLISLGRTALEHIGPDDAPASQASLDMARQTIDLICVLDQKTKGNLDEEENALLSSMLHELRGRFDKKSAAAS